MNFDSLRSVSKIRDTQLRQRLLDPVLGTSDPSITRVQSQQRTVVERERETKIINLLKSLTKTETSTFLGRINCVLYK